MIITIPVEINIPDEEIEKHAQECDTSVESYRRGLIWDKVEILNGAINGMGFEVDDSRVEVE